MCSHQSTNSEIWKPYFDPDVFGMFLITNEWRMLFLVRILFQWELDELIRLHVLLLLLYRELLHVLLEVKGEVWTKISQNQFIKVGKLGNCQPKQVNIQIFLEEEYWIKTYIIVSVLWLHTGQREDTCTWWHCKTKTQENTLERPRQTKFRILEGTWLSKLRPHP